MLKSSGGPLGGTALMVLTPRAYNALTFSTLTNPGCVVRQGCIGRAAESAACCGV